VLSRKINPDLPNVEPWDRTTKKANDDQPGERQSIEMSAEDHPMKDSQDDKDSQRSLERENTLSDEDDSAQ
jgi:hypothetical protein